MDCYSRRIVGWSMRPDLEADLVVDALEMAIARRRPKPGLVHHSDQGSQYVSLRFGERGREIGIHRSMGSKGDCFDNAVAESFFATLEKDLSAAAPSRRDKTHEPPCSITSRRSTTRSGSTPPSTTYHRPSTRRCKTEKPKESPNQTVSTETGALHATTLKSDDVGR